MSLWKIAFRSMQQRGLASWLTTISMALGVMLVVAVLTIHGVVTESFKNNASLGYNMIVGAKGGRLELTLNTVYYLSQPVENVDYDYYLEFLPQQQRESQYSHSFAHHGNQQTWETAAAQAAVLPGLPGMASLLATAALEEADRSQRLESRKGKFSDLTRLAVPVCLGDFFGRFRVVGTTSALFGELYTKEYLGRDLAFSAGQNFRDYSPEHGYYEAIIGAQAAAEQAVGVGDQFSPAHGDPEGEGHEQKFTIVGVVAPTGTPIDRAVFVNMEGFFLMEDHAKPVEKEEGAAEEETGDQPPAITPPSTEIHEKKSTSGQPQRLPVEQREVTSLLVRTTNPLVTSGLMRTINKGKEAQAVLPVREVYNLLDAIVQPIQAVLLVLTAMICVVSGVSILVSIYNSMSDRRHEIAVLRALGASRGVVMSVILLESIFLAVGGGLLGWIFGHALNGLASPYVEQMTGVSIKFWQLAPPTESFPVSPEIILIPALLALAVVVGFLPSLTAYRTDVARSLGK